MTKDELEFALMKLNVYESFFKKFMRAKADQFENLQRKAVEIGVQLGLPYTPTSEEEFKENTLYGEVLITGKQIDAEGNLKFNIAKVDEEKSIIATTRKMGITHQELLEEIATSTGEGFGS